MHGNDGSLQSLTGRVVRGVFALLLFELGEDIAKRRFFLGTWLVLEGVSDLLGLLLHENCEGFVFILAHLRSSVPRHALPWQWCPPHSVAVGCGRRISCGCFCSRRWRW